MIQQKGQAKKLAIVRKVNNQDSQFTKQRALGAYLASICQPEAIFDYSIAAQTQTPNDEDIDN